MSQYTALAAQIDQAMVDLKGVDQRIDELLTQAKTTSDRAYLEAAALYLHTFYSGAEQIFVEIAREIDGTVPEHDRAGE